LRIKKLLISFATLIFISFFYAMYNLIIGKFVKVIYFGFPVKFLIMRKYIIPIYKGITFNLLNFIINILICYAIYELTIWLIKKLNINILKN
jgi:hypothetical protein